jgi:hypothetical protein
MIVIKQGDTLPILEDTLKAAGLPINLSGCTIRFIMKDGLDNTLINKLGEIVNAAEGRVKYVWEGEDTHILGRFEGEWKITFPSGDEITVPNDKYIKILIM